MLLLFKAVTMDIAVSDGYVPMATCYTTARIISVISPTINTLMLGKWSYVGDQIDLL